MLKKILLAFAALLIVLVIVIVFQPSSYQVVRSARIAAPPAKVFGLVNDFHEWARWSPWEKIDAAMKKTYEGAPAGKGAVYAWEGNNEVGSGRMTLTESQPAELVKIKLEFIKPFAALCDTDFNFKPDGDQTVVTWTMAGTNNFIGKAMCLFMTMDKMVGGDFDKGLAQMKAAAESAPK